MNAALHVTAQNTARRMVADVVTIDTIRQFKAECDEANAFANNPAIIAANNEYRDLVLRYVREFQSIYR